MKITTILAFSFLLGSSSSFANKTLIAKGFMSAQHNAEFLSGILQGFKSRFNSYSPEGYYSVKSAGQHLKGRAYIVHPNVLKSMNPQMAGGKPLLLVVQIEDIGNGGQKLRVYGVYVDVDTVGDSIVKSIDVYGSQRFNNKVLNAFKENKRLMALIATQGETTVYGVQGQRVLLESNRATVEGHDSIFSTMRFLGKEATGENPILLSDALRIRYLSHTDAAVIYLDRIDMMTQKQIVDEALEVVGKLIKGDTGF